MKKIKFLNIYIIYSIFWFCILLISNIKTMDILEKIETTMSIFMFGIVMQNMPSMILSTYFLSGGKNNTRDIIRFKNIMICFKIFSFFLFIITLLIGVIELLSLLISNEEIGKFILICMTLPMWLSLNEGVNKATERLENGFWDKK